jgi:hypothetical protein
MARASISYLARTCNEWIASTAVAPCYVNIHIRPDSIAKLSRMFALAPVFM